MCSSDLLLIDDISSLSYCNDLSLDLNTSSTINVSHACVDSPYISSKTHLYKSHDDMLALSCCHDKKMLVFPLTLVGIIM